MTRARTSGFSTPLLALTLLAYLLAGCDDEVRRVDVTQLTARIYVEPAVRAAMASLRVRSFSEIGGVWTAGQEASFPVAELFSPADVAFVPRRGSATDRPFEIVVEAVDTADRVLVQQRALTGFVSRQQRILELWLYPCGDSPLGQLCASDPLCHGSECLTCVRGACGPTPTYDETDGLLPLAPTAAIDPNKRPPSDGSPRPLDGGLAERDDAQTNTRDGGSPELDGGAEAGASCPTGRGFDAGVCIERDDCVGVSSCAPGSCVDGRGSYSCRCPAGYSLQGTACVALDPCLALACEQRCVSRLGTAQCACNGGQVLASDGKTCRAGSWSEPTVLSETGSEIALAVSPAGNAMALWLESSPPRHELWSRQFRANSWQAPALVEANDDAIARAPDVSIDALDRSTALWVHFGEREEVSASRHVDGAWQAPRSIDDPSSEGGPSDLKVVSSPAGVTFAVWRRGIEGSGRVYANRMDERGGWSTAQPIGMAASGQAEALWPDLAIDHRGVATAVWSLLQLGAAEPPLGVVSSFQNGSWTMPRGIDPTGDNRAFIARVTATAGAAHVLWSTPNGVFRSVVAADREPALQPLILASNLETPTVAASEFGVTAAWQERAARSWRLWVARETSMGGFSEPIVLDEGPVVESVLERVYVAAGPDGTSAILWTATKSGATTLYARRYVSGPDGWGPSSVLGTPGAALSDVDVGIDEGGRILAVWSERTVEGGARVVSRRFE